MAEIPVLLLKTRTTPDDGYDDYFSTPHTASEGSVKFKPIFVPVLEHTPNIENLERLEGLLRSGKLKEKYGGMIFTSQRAVEGWRGVVERVERDVRNNSIASLPYRKGTLSNPTTEPDTLDYSSPDLPVQDSDIPFPLYVVGPATERSLSGLLQSSNSSTRSRNDSAHPCPFTSLNPQIHGADTGSGAALAPFILSHYNNLYTHRIFTFWEAPRLPFIPLVGPGPSPSKTADGTVRRGGMVRLERDDVRLVKRPLLFLVGETRRDVIPKTLMDERLGEGRVEVEEVEVYRTEERRGFGEEFGERFEGIREEGKGRQSVVVVVVFSPQGCESMLRAIGYIDDEGRITERAQMRWQEPTHALDGGLSERNNMGPNAGLGKGEMMFVIATIGPTTRDYLVDRFGFEPDVCAKKPSPEGVGEEIKAFLSSKGLVQ